MLPLLKPCRAILALHSAFCMASSTARGQGLWDSGCHCCPLGPVFCALRAAVCASWASLGQRSPVRFLKGGFPLNVAQSRCLPELSAFLLQQDVFWCQSLSALSQLVRAFSLFTAVWRFSNIWKKSTFFGAWVPCRRWFLHTGDGVLHPLACRSGSCPHDLLLPTLLLTLFDQQPIAELPSAVSFLGWEIWDVTKKRQESVSLCRYRAPRAPFAGVRKDTSRMMEQCC